jgi:hypothetical protein
VSSDALINMSVERRHEIARAIADELAKGDKSLSQLLYYNDPRIGVETFRLWREKYKEINDMINEAFDVSADNVAGRMKRTALGYKQAQGGESTGSWQRDRLVIYVDEKRLAVLDSRYSSRSHVMLSNDPDNPVTDVRPSKMSRDQLLRIAQGIGETEKK